MFGSTAGADEDMVLRYTAAVVWAAYAGYNREELGSLDSCIAGRLEA